MRFLLVLQFSGSSIQFEELLALEHRLGGSLRGIAEIDGHDLGPRQANIFILTGEPRVAFARIKSMVISAPEVGTLRAAYREISGDSFVTLWPETGSTVFNVE